MALARRGVSLDGTPIWEVDYSGLLLTRDPAGDQWRVRILTPRAPPASASSAATCSGTP